MLRAWILSNRAGNESLGSGLSCAFFAASRLAEDLGHLEGFDTEAFIRFIVRHCELTLLQEALLREHILGGCTQQEFADKWGLSVRGIGGRKGRLLWRIRDCLGGT